MSQPFCSKRRLRDRNTPDFFSQHKAVEMRPEQERDSAARAFANELWERDHESFDVVPIVRITGRITQQL